MDNKVDDLENVLVDILINNRVDHSKNWLNLPLKELIKQFESFRQKRIQSVICEKDQRRRSNIANGLFINALLTLMNDNLSLEKSKGLEFAAPETSNSFGEGIKNFHAKNLDNYELSLCQKTHLNSLAHLLSSVLDFKDQPMESVYRSLGANLSFNLIGEWQRRHIKWQAAAQVFWLDIEANTKEIRKKLLSSQELVDLLDLGILPNVDKSPKEDEVEFRNLEKVIRIVNPRGVKRGRPRKNAVSLQPRVFMPLVYSEAHNEVNCEGLEIAINVIVKVFRIQKKSMQEILNHPLIDQYRSLFLRSPFFKKLVDELAVSAFKS